MSYFQIISYVSYINDFWMIEIFMNELLNCLVWDWVYRHNQNIKLWILDTVSISRTYGKTAFSGRDRKAAVESKDSSP